MKLPYLPNGREIKYVPVDHPHLQAAKLVAETESLDTAHQTGAIIVKDDKIIGAGANGSKLHINLGCIRKKLHIKTGTKYFLCPGCAPKNHAEQTALKSCKLDPKDADLYLWGHWWCCQSCWQSMIKSGIKNVYLPVEADKKFKK